MVREKGLRSKDYTYRDTYRVPRLGLKVLGLGVQGLRFQVNGFKGGFRVKGVRIQGVGSRA